MKAYYYCIVLLCVALYYGCTSHTEAAGKKPGNDTIPVQVIALNRQNSSAGIAVSGQFTTDDEVMLSFKTGGIINSLLVKEGDAVKKGQLLATLNLTEINAQVQQAQLNREKAQRDYQRILNLYNDSVATLEQLQNTKTTLQLAEQQLNAAAFNRQYSEIRASQDGYVLHKLANVGQVVSSGTPVLQTNGAGSGKWLLRVGISDREWAMLKLNDAAAVQTTALPGQVWEGRVSRKSEGVDAATGTFTADITLTAQKPKAIAAGMFGKAVIHPAAPAEGTGGWQIPYEALLDGDGGTGYVFVTNDNRTAHKLKVTVGGITQNTVTITDGLQDASSLIVSGSAYLTDNSPISIQSPVIPAK